MRKLVRDNNKPLTEKEAKERARDDFRQSINTYYNVALQGMADLALFTPEWLLEDYVFCKDDEGTDLTIKIMHNKLQATEMVLSSYARTMNENPDFVPDAQDVERIKRAFTSALEAEKGFEAVKEEGQPINRTRQQTGSAGSVGVCDGLPDNKYHDVLIHIRTESSNDYTFSAGQQEVLDRISKNIAFYIEDYAQYFGIKCIKKDIIEPEIETPKLNSTFVEVPYAFIPAIVPARPFMNTFKDFSVSRPAHHSLSA